MPNWRQALEGAEGSILNLSHLFNIPSSIDMKNLWQYAARSYDRTGPYTYDAASFAEAVDQALTNVPDSFASRMLEKTDPRGNTALMIAESAETSTRENAEMINVLLKHSARLGLITSETAEMKLRPVRSFNPYAYVSDAEYANSLTQGRLPVADLKLNS